MPLRIVQTHALPGAQTLDRIESLIVFLPRDAGEGRRFALAHDLPYADVLDRRLRRAGVAAAEPGPWITDLPNEAGTRVSLSLVDRTLAGFELLELARRHASRQLRHRPRNVAAVAPGFASDEARRILEAVVAALLAGHMPMPEFKSRKPPAARLAGIRLFGLSRRLDPRRTRAEAEGNGLARTLTALPPNTLTPGTYRRRIARLAREHGWRMEFLDSRALRRKKAGAFLAVTQGSATDDAGIVHLRYTPPRPANRPALALVGKGICYDTGGMNLKSAKHMHGMHEDMAGSAVALGTLLALSRLRVPFPVHCWLALAQNHIGPRAYKQNDIVTACDGTTIEVVHTDAEGRMVLADTLALAARRRPALIIDYATLTGACVYALGTRYSGAFTNREPLIQACIAAGRASGERVWPFPLDDDFDKPLRSDFADLKQCTLAGEADHILAARFLKRFVNDRPWLHLDLSAANCKGGLAHIPTDITGFGVRFTLNLLLEGDVLKQLDE